MGNQQIIRIESNTGVPRWTAHRMVRSFLSRHGTGLDDLLRRFPNTDGPAFRRAIEACLSTSETALELAMVLEEATDTLLSLLGEDCHALPVDTGRRFQVDAGLRWYAARLHDLARAARKM